MKFKDRLRQSMADQNLTQMQLAKLIGRSKASVSQYLSGVQIPSEETQRQIGEILGWKEEPKSDVQGVQRLDIYTAAKLLGMNHVTVRKGLQQGVFPWGYAIKTSETRWTYFINAKKFAEIEGVEVNV